MMFKGTSSKTSKDISVILDNLGGSYNAGTSFETTCYYGTVIRNDLDKLVDIFYEMLTDLQFTKEQVEDERKVIQQERLMYEDDPISVTYDLLFKNMMPTNRLGLSILGNEDSIDAINSEMLFKFKQTYYIPKNMTIVITGNGSNITQILEKLETTFGEIENKESNFSLVKIQKPIMTYGYFPNFNTNINQTHIAIGFNSIPLHSNLSGTLSVMNSIFSNGMSSMLFQTIREQYGKAYSVSGGTSKFSDVGISSIYIGTSEEHLSDIPKLLKEEVYKLYNLSISEDKLADVKNRVKSSILMSFDDIEGKLYGIGERYAINGKDFTLEEKLQLIDNTTVNDIREMAMKIYDLDKSNITLYGNFKMESFK